MYHEWATDPKIQMLSEPDQRRYVMLLCLRCCNGDVTLHDDEVAFQLRVTATEWQETKAALVAKNLIDAANTPVGWGGRQSRDNDRPPSNVWRDIREQVFHRDNYTCQYCGERGGKLECDHVIPVCQGGPHELTNLVTSCKSCNQSKAGKTPKQWAEWRATQ